MADDATAPGAGKHEQARRLAEQAVKAEADGNTDRAQELFAAATRTDATAVADVLQQEDTAGARAPRTAGESDTSGPRDAETVEPESDAPSRAGITQTGSGADTERR